MVFQGFSGSEQQKQTFSCILFFIIQVLFKNKGFVTIQVMFDRLNKGIPSNTLLSESMTFKFCFLTDEI